MPIQGALQLPRYKVSCQPPHAMQAAGQACTAAAAVRILLAAATRAAAAAAAARASRGG
jgi:hypothetical protein